jgi:hypothetical protein
VESYHSGLRAEELQKMVSRIREAISEMSADGKAIRHVSSMIVPTDESFLCLIDAASEQYVRVAYERAGFSYQRISPALTEDS